MGAPGTPGAWCCRGWGGACPVYGTAWLVTAGRWCTMSACACSGMRAEQLEAIMPPAKECMCMYVQHEVMTLARPMLEQWHGLLACTKQSRALLHACTCAAKGCCSGVGAGGHSHLYRLG